MIRPALLLLLALPGIAAAATHVERITADTTSVLGGESQVYAARFFRPAPTSPVGGPVIPEPAAGETVTFSNDACGTFDNGGFLMTTVTDSTGVASARFTARNQGITCTVAAEAGVRATFYVLTYTMGMVTISGSTFPAEPRPGEKFTFRVSAKAGGYGIYGGRSGARVIPAEAAYLRELPGAGGGGITQFEVTRASHDGFQLEYTHRNLVQRFTVAPIENPLTDMWWGGQEEYGWGMSIVQHGERLFATIFAYDSTGAPTWFVMPGGTWNDAHTTFTGALYSPRGTPYTAYDASRLVVGAPVGTATLTFNALDSATLDYVIGGVSGRKAITRQLFGEPWEKAAPMNAGDMWWGGPSQNGWGLALLQQHYRLFGVWYTYDANGAPTWFVIPIAMWSFDGFREAWGRMFRTTGVPWVGQPFDRSRLSWTELGNVLLRFEGDSATMSYTIDGRSGTLTLSRQAF